MDWSIFLEKIVKMNDLLKDICSKYEFLYKQYQKFSLEHDYGKNVLKYRRKVVCAYADIEKMKEDFDSIEEEIKDVDFKEMEKEPMVAKEILDFQKKIKQLLFFKNWVRAAAEIYDLKCFGINLTILDSEF